VISERKPRSTSKRLRLTPRGSRVCAGGDGCGRRCNHCLHVMPISDVRHYNSELV